MLGTVIKDLSDWAEDRFSALCAEAGVTRNKSTQDRSGWDYLIQFPPTEIPGMPTDMAPGEHSARVQVKSKKKGQPVISLKLSNALRFAKESDPCFIILFLASEGCEPVRIYAKHFWAREIENTLRQARRADRRGRTDLHKIALQIRFGDADDHSIDLLSWLAATVRAEGGRYAENKSALCRSLGFEDGSFHGTITFAVKDLGALIDHQIGLNPIAPIANVTIRNRRFGIEAHKPIFNGKPDTAHIRTHPIACRVRVRTPDAADVWLNGSLFRSALPGIALELCKLRVVADFLEIIMSGDRQGTVTYSFSDSDQRTIPSLRALVDVMRGAENGPLRIQISGEGLPNLPLTVTIPTNQGKDELKQLSAIVTCLEAVTAGILPAGLTLSFAAIGAAWNAIVDFNGLVTGTDLHGRFELDRLLDATLAPAMSIYLYDYVDIGAWTFLAVVRRPIVRWQVQGSSIEFHCGAPRVSESLVKRGTGSAYLAELQELYRQSVKTEKVGILEAYDGSYRALLLTSRGGADSIKKD